MVYVLKCCVFTLRNTARRQLAQVIDAAQSQEELSGVVARHAHQMHPATLLKAMEQVTNVGVVLRWCCCVAVDGAEAEAGAGIWMACVGFIERLMVVAELWLCTLWWAGTGSGGMHMCRGRVSPQLP